MKIRRSGGELTLADYLALGCIEGLLTIAGLLVLIFPLALWAVPQHGPLANSIFGVVMTIGSSAIAAVLGLAYLKGFLYPEFAPEGTPTGSRARLQAYQTWADTQDEIRRAGANVRTMEGGAMRDFAKMARVASFLATFFILLNLVTWAAMDFFYGSTKVLSAEQRWELYRQNDKGFQ